MKVTIHSPLKPLFFRQMLTTSAGYKGYLSAKLLHQFTNNQSYKVKIGDILLELREQKKKDGKRNWALLFLKNKDSIKIGNLTMDSLSNETLKTGSTKFILSIKDKPFHAQKEYMQIQDKCHLYDINNNIVASYLKPSLLKKNIETYIEDDLLLNSALIISLSLIVFVS
ncbi:hypothetical protein MKX54_03685 [Alkalihalobacillus sp. FSL R5-0424]